MNAQVLYGIGDLRYEEPPAPVPAPGEALVRVRACGICGSDVPRVFDTGAHRHPIIIGHEFSGEVEDISKAGEGAERWLGKRVGVFPLIPCGKCAACLAKRYELCRSYDYLGSRRDGGFAEVVSVPVGNLVELPGEASFEEAAMLEPMAVAVHAMRRAGIGLPEKGVTERTAEDRYAVVIGLGTIGLLLAMFLKDAGLERILAVGNKDFQKLRARELGIPDADFCDARERDAVSWIRDRTGGEGADVVFECVGRSQTYAQAVSSASCAGRVVLVGNPASDMMLDRDVYWRILRNQLTVTGTWNSSYTGSPDDDWNYVLERVAQKRVAPAALITHRLPLEDLPKGLRMMRDKTEDYGKVMIESGGGD